MNELNDAAILDQVRDYWRHIAALLVWKLAPNGVHLTSDDMVQFKLTEKVLLTYGHGDSIEFRMITRAEADTLAAHDQATNRGTA